MNSFQIKSSATQLMSKARQLAGTDDIIDTDIEERLEQLLQSLNTDAQLSQSGAEAMEQRLLRLLGNRLRMQRDFARHPEIRDQKIVRPVILTGGPRTGSTKLQKLLAASGDFLFMPGWQGFNLGLRTGNRDEDPSQRIRESDEYAHWFNEQAPQAMLIHEYSTFEPDEESLIFEHCLYAPYLMAFVFVPGYAQWYMAQEFRKDFEFVKQGLQYLQWQFYNGDRRPWVLKCPTYLGVEPIVADAFPDAFFVTTNRNPISTMSSVASVCSNYHQAYSDADRKQFLGAMMLEGYGMATQKHLAARDGHPELKFLDIGYTELTQDEEHVIEKVYAHLDMRLSDTARQALRKWVRENPQHKLGVHKYTLEEYALTPDMVKGKCKGYIERFSQYF